MSDPRAERIAAYRFWLEDVDRALKASGHAKGVFGFRNRPLPYAKDGTYGDEDGEAMAWEADLVAKAAGLKRPRM